MSYLANKIRQYKDSEFFRNIITLFSGNVVAQIIPLLAYPVLTRLYQPSDFGTLALFTSIVGILSVMATGRYELSVILPKRDEDAAGLLVLSLALSIVFCLVIGLVLLFCNAWLLSFPGLSSLKVWLYLIPLSVLLSALYQCFNYWTIRVKKFRHLAFAGINQSMSTSIGKLILGFAGFLKSGLLAGNLFGQFSSVLALGVSLFYRRKGEFRSVTRSTIKTQAKIYNLYPKFNLIHAFTNIFSGNLPIFVLASYFSQSAVGYFSLGLGLVFKPLNLFTTSVQQVFSQKIVERYNKQQTIYANVKTMVWRIFKIELLPFIVALFLAPLACKWVLGNKWETAGLYLQFLIPWLFMVGLATPLSFIPEIFFCQKKAMIIDIIYLVFRIISLAIGVWARNLYLAIGLYSFVGVIVVGYNLFWYLELCRNADKDFSQFRKN
ncbi:MAG: oligosaccharide flippase family protein [Bacteroidota bacterium]|nr:oligosaccharide flippase family protein [Bacteroidota bacterium]